MRSIFGPGLFLYKLCLEGPQESPQPKMPQLWNLLNCSEMLPFAVSLQQCLLPHRGSLLCPMLCKRDIICSCSATLPCHLADTVFICCWRAHKCNVWVRSRAMLYDGTGHFTDRLQLPQGPTPGSFCQQLLCACQSQDKPARAS